VPEQQGLGGDGADATGAEELRNGDQQVDGKEEDFSHRANRTITAGTCKTARRLRIASHYEFATHSVKMRIAGVRGNVPSATAAPEPEALRSLRKPLIQVSPFSEILVAWPANHCAHLQMKSSRHSGAPDG